MDTVLIENSASLNYTGAGFKDFTRIAGSDPVMWANIFIDNKINIISFAKNFIKNLESWIEAYKKR
jgi:prephenate dehydrogenase